MADDSPATGTAEKPGEDDAALLGKAPVPSEIPSCCIDTICTHVRHNPMMVCAECKNIIKCFKDERAFQNYMTFCRSRRRPVLTGKVQEYWTVAFRSYDTYNR